MMEFCPAKLGTCNMSVSDFSCAKFYYERYLFFILFTLSVLRDPEITEVELNAWISIMKIKSLVTSLMWLWVYTRNVPLGIATNFNQEYLNKDILYYPKVKSKLNCGLHKSVIEGKQIWWRTQIKSRWEQGPCAEAGLATIWIFVEITIQS